MMVVLTHWATGPLYRLAARPVRCPELYQGGRDVLGLPLEGFDLSWLDHCRSWTEDILKECRKIWLRSVMHTYRVRIFKLNLIYWQDRNRIRKYFSLFIRAWMGLNHEKNWVRKSRDTLSTDLSSCHFISLFATALLYWIWDFFLASFSGAREHFSIAS